MANEQSDIIKTALERAISHAKSPSLQAAAQELAAGNSLSTIESVSQFPPSGPFVRSTW